LKTALDEKGGFSRRRAYERGENDRARPNGRLADCDGSDEAKYIARKPGRLTGNSDMGSGAKLTMNRGTSRDSSRMAMCSLDRHEKRKRNAQKRDDHLSELVGTFHDEASA
jgi:hypothetical protein